MKKIFLFAAAAIAALTVNAKVLDLTTAGTTIDEWTINDATLNTSESDAAKGKYVYDIKAEIPSETFVTAEPSVVFQTKNSSDKAKSFVVYPGKCYEFGGKNGILIIKGAAVGDAIKLTVAAKGSNNADFKDAAGTYPKNAIAVSTDLVLPAKEKGAEGADEEGYIWKVLEYQAIGGDIEIKEFNGGYRITKIEIGNSQAVDNIFDGAKAEKIMENGQLVIIKNGVKFNALGAQL